MRYGTSKSVALQVLFLAGVSFVNISLNDHDAVSENADTRDPSGVTQQPQAPKVRRFRSFDLKACLIVVACLLTTAFGEPGNTCNSKTQFLVEHENGSTSCVDCEPCPAGQTLSIECGKRILSSTMVICVACKLGVSFSSKSGTSVCTPCSSCAKDQVVLQNCKPTQDIKCEKRCYGKDRYFDDDKGDCFPCSKCCQDEQDVVENECREKLGTGSNMICSFHSSINRCDKSTPFAQESTTTTDQSTITNNYTTPSQSSKHEHTVPPTAQPAKHHDLLIAVSIFVPLIIIIIIIAVCLYIHKARLTGCYSWCNCNTKTGVAEMENGTYPTCRGNCKPTKKNLDMFEKGQVKTNEINHGILPSESQEPLLGKGTQEEMPGSCQQESKLLSSLLDDEPYLRAISVRLDTTLAGAGNYRAVAQYYGLNHYTISSVLEKNDRGATTSLIESLAATNTKVTVQEFAAVVRQKAKRKDVAELLEAYDSGKKLGRCIEV